MRTAPLDQMSGALCDHVLGRSDSAGRLAEAARRNLFVVPLDRRGEWYRYHRLVAEMLLSELRRREPGEESRVHRRAAGWYEEQGQPEKAIAHALAGGDTLAAARLINRHARDFVAAGRLQTVRGWLDALDEDGLVELSAAGDHRGVDAGADRGRAGRAEVPARRGARIVRRPAAGRQQLARLRHHGPACVLGSAGSRPDASGRDGGHGHRAARQPVVPGGDGDARHRPRAHRRCRRGGQGARPGGPARPRTGNRPQPPLPPWPSCHCSRSTRTTGPARRRRPARRST